MDSIQENIPVNVSAWVIYFHVGTLSVMIWDIANRVKSDYNLLVSDFCIKTFLYLLSRTMTFLYAFTKVVYFTIPMSICAILDRALSAFYVVAIFATLFLSTIHLVLLLDKKRPVVATMFTFCALVVGGNVIFPIGVSGRNPQPTQSRGCQDFVHEYTAAAFILLCVYHAVMLCILTLAARQSVSDDRENLTTQERYSRMSRRNSMFAVSKSPSTEHYVFYILTTALSLATTVWFLVARGSNGSFRLIPVVVYLVCANITLGSVLRANKRLEKQRRVSEALSVPIKLDIPRLDINDTLVSQHTMRALSVPDDNSQGTQCDVVGLFQTDSASCMPPVVEIEVNKVVQSKHDYSSDYIR